MNTKEDFLTTIHTLRRKVSGFEDDLRGIEDELSELEDDVESLAEVESTEIPRKGLTIDIAETIPPIELKRMLIDIFCPDEGYHCSNDDIIDAIKKSIHA